MYPLLDLKYSSCFNNSKYTRDNYIIYVAVLQANSNSKNALLFGKFIHLLRTIHVETSLRGGAAKKKTGQVRKDAKKEEEQGQAIEMLCTEMLAPQDHLLKKINAVGFTR